MRKSFTLLFSALFLCVFGFSSFAAAPQLQKVKPADGATNVKPTTTHLVVDFDQNVKFTATGGTLTIYQNDKAVKTVALVAGNANAVIAADSLKVKHGLTLTDGTAYSVTITNNAIENAAGEKFAGITAGNWDFTTGDYTAPVVKTLTPADDAANVDVQTASLVIGFDDASDILAVSGKKVWVYEADGTIVDIITIDGTNTSVSGKTATIDIDNTVFDEEPTGYYVNVEAGAFTDASDNKNKFAGIMNKTSWNFNSRDYSAPYITEKGVTNISFSSATLSATANEAGSIWYKRQLKSETAPAVPATTTGGWTKVATGTGNAITASLSGMDDATEYVVYLIAENKEAIQQPAASTVGFKTLDNTAPTASNPTLVNESNVTVGAKLTFNEEIVAGSGDLLVKRQSNNETVRTVPAAEAVITKGEKENAGKWFMTARFEGLESGVGYYIIIPSGYVEDAAGNDYVSTYVTTGAWAFNASDFVAPTVTVSVAASTPPAAADNIAVKFSEGVRLVDGKDMSTLSTAANWFDYLALEKNNVAVPFTASYSAGTITIDPVNDLAPNSTYVVIIRANSFEDLNDNAFSTVHKTYEVKTGDFGAAAIAYDPADGENEVEEGTQPKITFSKVAKISGTTAADITAANLKPLVTFKKSSAAGENVPFTLNWDAASRTATLVPDAALASGGVYYVDIDHTKVEDAYGSDFTDPGTSTFTMEDFVAPTVTFSHSGTVTDKDSITNITITFKEDVTLNGDVNKLVVFKQNDVSGANLDFTASFDETANVITIDPADPLKVGKVYYYGIGAGAAQDAAENKNAAAFATFTFAPVAPPQVEVAEGGYVPAIGATGVKVNSSGNLVASLTFTEAVKANPTMPSSHNAVLNDSTGAAVSTVAVSAGAFEGSKLTITFPGVTLDSEMEYYITLDADVVVANANNKLTFPGIEAEEWTFTAADVVKPLLTANTPAADAAGVALDAAVKINADEDVVVGTGNITIAAGTADAKTVAVADAVIDNKAGTITVPHAALTQYGTVYTVTVPAGAFKDAAGNANIATTWSFTTVANPAPAVASLDPADEEDLVAAGTKEFVIEFSEEVVKGASGTVAFLFEKGTGTNRAVLNGNGTATANNDIQKGAILVSSNNVQVNGKLVTLNFEGFELEAGKEYFILVESGMFKDKSLPTAANFAGITSYDAADNAGWNFYTMDVKAPTWEESYTERGEGMDITSDIVITFSKPIEKSTGSEITNADVANLFTLTVGGQAIAFTGNINAEKTVVVLENASFIPALTKANSEQTVSVAPTSGIRGKVNQKAVSTTAATFKVSDYQAPTVTLTEGTVKGEEFTFNVSSNEAGTIYWTVMEGRAGTVTAEEVMEGTVIDNYTSGLKTVTVTENIESDSVYTVYAVAVDKAGNVSTVKTEEVETLDITKPLLVNKTNAFTSGGVLSLEFNENVVPGGATATIRLAGTLEIVEEVALTATSDLDSLVLTSTDALGYADGQKFVIEVEGGAVADAAGNTWDGLIGLGENAWVVSLPDRTAPTLVSIDPKLPTTDPRAKVALDANFVLTFSENIKLAKNAQLQIYHYDGSSMVLFEVLEGSAVKVEGSKLTLNPTRTFVSGERYELKITAGSVLDMADLQHGSITRLFDGIDNVAPVVTFSPKDGAVDVPQGQSLAINFSEAVLLTDSTAVDKFDLESMVYLTKDGAAVAHTASINAAKKVITIIPGANLEKGVSYTYGFTEGFMDAAKNEVAAAEATFTVVTDAVAETYIVFDPDNGVTADPTVVPVDQVFSIIFSGELNTFSKTASQNNIPASPTYLHGATAGAGAITLTQNGTNVPFTATVDRGADESVVTVTPNSALASEKEYVLTVVDSMLQLGVGNANILASESNDYLTEDALAPTATLYTPADGTTSPSSGTLSVSFNEKVMAGTGTIEVREAFGAVALTIEASELTIENNLVKITALTELEAGQEYFVLIPAGVITDLSGNAWAGIDEEDEWNFSISETLAAPQVVNISPVGGNALVNSSLVITFDRPVEPSDTGYVALYTAAGVAVELVRDGFTFSDDNKVVTVDIGDLAQNTKYEVEVAAGTFVLVADNSLANAAVTRSMWTFTTEINEPPVLDMDMLTPADNATDVSLRTVARMVFDITVQPGTGEITLRRGGSGEVVHAFDVNSDEVNFEGRVVTFSLEGLLEANATDYYIIVPAGAITNVSEVPEPFAGLVQMSSWNFTTQDDGNAPELVTWSPDEVEIEGNQPVFVMEFNETVVVAGEGNLVVTEVGATEPTLVIPVTAEMVNDTAITVEYDWRTYGTLKYGTEYFVTVDGGFIEDEWENIWEGVTDETAWTFSTEDLGISIADIQGTGSTSPMVDELVEVTGTITAISANEGFFMQDANAAWSGIWVAYGETGELAIGDGAVVEGTVAEVSEVTTIDATTVEVVEAPLAVEAVVVDSPSAAKAEMYESVYVEVRGARATAADNNGVWNIFYQTTDNVNVNDWFYTYDALVEGNFYNVAGVVNARMSNFRLEPRMESDIFDITVETAVPVVSAADFKVYPNPFNGVINIDNSDKLSRVIITNIAGQRVVDVQYPEHTISTDKLVSGVYVISLFTEDGMVKSDRIVKR